MQITELVLAAFMHNKGFFMFLGKRFVVIKKFQVIRILWQQFENIYSVIVIYFFLSLFNFCWHFLKICFLQCLNLPDYLRMVQKVMQV